MIEEPTCLILGAGASAPYGLPVAGQLRELLLIKRSQDAAETAKNFPIKDSFKIGRRMGPRTPSNDWSIFLEMITENASLTNCLDQFWDRFFEADRSIDWFLRHNEAQFGRIARIQIAAALLNCETESRLTGNWYRSLLKTIFGADPNSLEFGKLSVITFNYDRSFERYFLRALKSQYRLGDTEAADALRRIPIKHVYGSLGNLDDIPYGDITKIQRAAKGINLARPEINVELKEELGAMMRRSTYVNFIGFGFDDDNLMQLGAENFREKGIKRILSTSFGLSPVTRKAAQRKVQVRFVTSASQAPLDAAELLESIDIFGPKRQQQARPRVVRRPQSLMDGLGRGWNL